MSSADFDQQQLNFKADVEEALNALPDDADKAAFLDGLIDSLPTSFKSQGPNSNAIHFAKMRGLQQAISNLELPKVDQKQLTTKLSDVGMAAVLTSADHQLPVSERSMDHMATCYTIYHLNDKWMSKCIGEPYGT